MNEPSFVSELRNQVVRPLVHSALTEHEIPEVTVDVVVGTELESPLRSPAAPGWSTFDDGHAYVWVHATPKHASDGAEWQLGRLEDLQDPGNLIDALTRLGSDVEDWVCETSFAWGQARRVLRLDLGDLPGWMFAS